MSKFSDVFGGGSSPALGGWSRPIFSSKTINIVQSGTIVLSLLGSGGGGGFLATAGSIAGPNSGPWGRKKITVSASDVLVINLGAGGAKGAVTGVAGSSGGTSTVALNGVTILTVQGGEGGAFAAGTATANPTAATATVTGADFWVPGLQAGSAQANSGVSVSGGAAPDLLQTGLGRSPSVAGTAAGGLGGSLGTDLGGVPVPWIALAEWGLVITDGATASATLGAPGRGGAPAIMPGMFGGGRGVISGSDPQPGGFGAGGGSGFATATCFNGGSAYAHLTFTPAA